MLNALPSPCRPAFFHLTACVVAACAMQMSAAPGGACSTGPRPGFQRAAAPEAGVIAEPLGAGVILDPLGAGVILEPLGAGSILEPLGYGPELEPLGYGPIADPLGAGVIADPLG